MRASGRGCSTSAEEWLLWREYAAAATRRFALVNGGALAQVAAALE